MSEVELTPLTPSSSRLHRLSSSEQDRSAASNHCKALLSRIALSGLFRRLLVAFVAVLALLLAMKTIVSVATFSSSVGPSRRYSFIEESVPTMAFCGNSMLYYNDCPRLVEVLLLKMYSNTTSFLSLETESTNWKRLQDSCLRGGSDLTSLWLDGNGMKNMFIDRNSGGDTKQFDIGAPTVQSLLQTPPVQSCSSDGVDHERFSAKPGPPRQQSLQALRENYLPAIRSMDSKGRNRPTKVLFLQTFPYKTPRLRETLGLGGFDEFTDALIEGYEAYANLVDSVFGMPCAVVPMAEAMRQLSETASDELWERMYNWDSVHPSPHATWLQACLIVAVATGRAPPAWNLDIESAWQQGARFWQSVFPESHERRVFLPLPTPNEAEWLRQLACRLGLQPSTTSDNEDACSS